MIVVADSLSTPLLHSVFEHASDGIVVLDFDGYVLLANPAAAEIFHLSEEELRGEPFGYPVASERPVEIDIRRRDGSMGVAEMRISEGYCESEDGDYRQRDRDPVLVAMLRDITERKRMERELQDAHDKLSALYRQAPLGIVAARSDGRVSHWNRAAERILGWREEDAIGTPLATILRDFADMLNGVSRDNPVVGKEIAYRRGNGSDMVLSVSVSSLGQPDGGATCIIEDVTRRVRDAERLRLSARIFENTQEGILVTDAGGRIVSVNRAFCGVTGYSPEEVLGRTPNVLRSGRHGPEFYEAMWRSISKCGNWRGEIWNRRKNGEIYPEWLHITAIRDDRGEVTNYVALFSDITDVKANEEKLRHLAHYDILTGLPNRFLFQDHAELALAQAARSGLQAALLFLDLDHFKNINDTLGHRAGDALLVEVGRRLASCLRAGDTLSRIGGDEFNALLPNLDNGAAAAAVAEKFIGVLAEPFRIDGRETHVTTSIGIALYPQHGTMLDELRSAADKAMFEAKEHGRNTFRFHESVTSEDGLGRRFAVETQLRRALERGEFAVVYQPEVDLSSGRVTGLEALLRWSHPELGEVTPTEFIPVAEEIGIIAALGRWVLREACRQNKAWQDAGHAALPVAVNLSPYQLRDQRLTDTVSAVLAETGLSGSWLELELTGGLAAGAAGEIETLGALKQFGIRLSIDDFGTGHSSWADIRHLPVDTLKIDRSLIAQIHESARDAAISRAIVGLAGELGLRVVAEGVEAPEHLAALRKLECREAQGFHFSRPLPADELCAATDGFRQPLRGNGGYA